MPFVRRNSAGQVVAVSQVAGAGCTEEIDASAPALTRFLDSLHADPAAILGTDQGFIRVLEDLVDLLVEKKVFAFEELPQDAQVKITRRRQLRPLLRERTGSA